MHKDITSFISTFPSDVQIIMHKIHQLIMDLIPDAEEAMKYGIPTYRLKDKNLVHFSGFKHHIGFYPTPPVLEAFKDQIKQYKSAKGSVQFPLNKPIPYDLIKAMVKYRLTQI